MKIPRLGAEGKELGKPKCELPDRQNDANRGEVLGESMGAMHVTLTCGDLVRHLWV